MSHLTIQINDLSALERLIGGDTQVEMDIRHSLVQKFAEKHLKPLANSANLSNTLRQITEDIRKQVKEKCESEIATFKKSNAWSDALVDVKLRPEIQREIDAQVRTIIDTTIKTAVDNALEFWAKEASIKRRVDERFEYYTKKMVDDIIKERVEKLKASL